MHVYTASVAWERGDAAFTDSRYSRRHAWRFDGGVMEKNEEGKMAITRATLRPRVVFGPAAPTPDELEQLHHEAHERCYIANSVRTRITIVPAAQAAVTPAQAGVVSPTTGT